MSEAPRKLRDVMRVLRREVPTLFPVRVRTRPDCADDQFAGCALVTPKEGTPYFSIVLHPGLHWGFVRLLLIHEYAHAFAWTEPHPNVDDHAAEFGVAYARCYRAVMGKSEKPPTSEPPTG